MQAVIGGAEALGEIARMVLVSGSWWMGVGVGEVEEPLPSDTREGRGPAFWSARDAITKAKAQRATRPVSAIGSENLEGVGLSLDECLGTLAFIINRRTNKQRQAAEAYNRTATVTEVAAILGISNQGARQRILAAGCEEESDLVSLCIRIARKAV